MAEDKKKSEPKDKPDMADWDNPRTQMTIIEKAE
jgi:hypothetical protein